MPFIPSHRSACLLVKQESIEEYPNRQSQQKEKTQIPTNTAFGRMSIDELDTLCWRSKPILLTAASDCYNANLPPLQGQQHVDVDADPDADADADADVDVAGTATDTSMPCTDCCTNDGDNSHSHSDDSVGVVHDEDRDTEEEHLDSSTDENDKCFYSSQQATAPDSVSADVSAVTAIVSASASAINTANSILWTEREREKEPSNNCHLESFTMNSKKSVRFESLSTLYVFDDDDDAEGETCNASKESDIELFSCYSTNDVASASSTSTNAVASNGTCLKSRRRHQDKKYNVNNAWYSSQELKAIRADTWLTVNWMVLNGVAGSNMAYITGKQEPVPSDNTDDMDCAAPPNTRPHSDSSLEENDDSTQTEHQQRQRNYKALHQMIVAREERPRNRAKGKQNLPSNLKSTCKNDTRTDRYFCVRGVECRTPMGRIVKNKRRLDAMRAVLLYQQLQKDNRRKCRRQQRNNRLRSQSYDASTNHVNDNDSHSSYSKELFRKVQIEIDSEALANVYGSYCEESSAVALALGQQDALAVGMGKLPPDSCSASLSVSSTSASLYSVRLSSSSSSSVSSRSESSSYSSSTPSSTVNALLPSSSSPSPLSPSSSPSLRRRSTSLEYPKTNGTAYFDCPSLCDVDDDEENESLDKLVSISHVHYPMIEEYDVEKDEPQEQEPKDQEEMEGPQELQEPQEVDQQEDQQDVAIHLDKPCEVEAQQANDDERAENDEEYSLYSRVSSCSSTSSYSVAISVASNSCSSNSYSNRSVVEVELYDCSKARRTVSCSSADSTAENSIVATPVNPNNEQSTTPSFRAKHSWSSKLQMWAYPSELLGCSSSSTDNAEPLASAPSSRSKSRSASNSFDKFMDMVSVRRDWW